jgi:hypothetical protein
MFTVWYCVPAGVLTLVILILVRHDCNKHDNDDNPCHVSFLPPFTRARLLADDVRAATVGYLSVIKGAEGGVTKLSVPRLHLHPALQRAYSSVEAAFRQVNLTFCSMRVCTAENHSMGRNLSFCACAGIDVAWIQACLHCNLCSGRSGPDMWGGRLSTLLLVGCAFCSLGLLCCNHVVLLPTRVAAAAAAPISARQRILPQQELLEDPKHYQVRHS